MIFDNAHILEDAKRRAVDIVDCISKTAGVTKFRLIYYDCVNI